MKILVIGSGGREHALVWKLAQSPNANAQILAVNTAVPVSGNLSLEIQLQPEPGGRREVKLIPAALGGNTNHDR